MLFNCIYILLIFYKLQAYFSSATSKISFTSDLWTSPHNKAFISVTGHYIDSEWNLCETVIDFELLKGKHDGTNIANGFFDILQSYNIASRVCIYLIFIIKMANLLIFVLLNTSYLPLHLTMPQTMILLFKNYQPNYKKRQILNGILKIISFDVLAMFLI